MKNISICVLFICLFANFSFAQSSSAAEQSQELQHEMRAIERQQGPGGSASSDTPINISLMGSVSYRFQYLNQEHKFANNPSKPDFTKQQEMQRMRIELGAKINIKDRIEAGILLSTPGDHENRQTYNIFGDSSTKFGLESIGISLGYIKAKLFSKKLLELTFGKFKNPLYSTHLVMACEVNPAGMFQKLNLNFGKINIGVNMGELVYSRSGGETEFSKWILTPQIFAKFNFGKCYFLIAPGLYAFLGRSHTHNYAASSSAPGYYETKFSLLSAYLEFGTKFGSIPFKIKAELIYNLAKNGKPAYIHASSPKDDLDNEDIALKIMLSLGKVKKMFDWQVIVGFMMSQTYALDPDLAMPFMMVWQTSDSGYKWNSSSLPWAIIAKARFMVYHHIMLSVDFMYRKRENKGWHLKKGNVFSQKGYVIKTTLELEF